MTDPKFNPEHHITEDLLPVVHELTLRREAQLTGEVAGIVLEPTDPHGYIRLAYILATILTIETAAALFLGGFILGRVTA